MHCANGKVCWTYHSNFQMKVLGSTISLIISYHDAPLQAGSYGCSTNWWKETEWLLENCILLTPVWPSSQEICSCCEQAQCSIHFKHHHISVCHKCKDRKRHDWSRIQVLHQVRIQEANTWTKRRTQGACEDSQVIYPGRQTKQCC